MFIGNINSTPSIDGGQGYFEGGRYSWTDKKGNMMVESNIKGILHECRYNTSMYASTSKKKISSVFYVNLKCPCPDWLGSAGKTHIDLRPFADDIAKTTSSLAQQNYAFATYDVAKDYLVDFLKKRREAVQADPSLKTNDRITQSGVWYRIRPKMMEDGFEPRESTSTANRNRVSVLKLLLTTMRRADNGGEYEHKRQFFTKDLIEALNISKSTARRVMKELEVLGLVRIGKEVKNGGYNYYIELLEKFEWLLQKEFQELIQGFDWEQVVLDKEEEEADNNNISKSIYRAYPGSDMWECKNCKLRGDIHFMENHHCSGCENEYKDKERRAQTDNEQTTL
jgi:Mn-dependent DtxR family transcriptional regulator